MPGWRHTKAACSNFLSATWTKCSLNLRSCPIHIFASRRYHLPQQECVAMPTQLVHLRFSVTDTRGKINSVLLSQDKQRWPRARQPGQNSASQAYGDSTGFLQPASLPTPTQEHMPHLSLVSFLLPEKPENMFLLRGPLQLQALISITTAFEVSQTDAYCKKQGYSSAFTYLSWGVLTVGSQREEWERKQSWCQGLGFVLGCPRLSPTPWHWTQWDVKLCVTLEKPWTFCTEHSVQRLSLVQGTQWRVHAPITLQGPWWTVHETAGNMGTVGNGLHKKSIAPGWWQLVWVLDF